MRFIDLVVFEYVHEGMHCWFSSVDYLQVSYMYVRSSQPPIYDLFEIVTTKKYSKFSLMYKSLYFESNTKRLALCECVSVDA